MEATRWWGYFWGYLVCNLGVFCQNATMPNIYAGFSHFQGHISATFAVFSARFFWVSSDSHVIRSEIGNATGWLWERIWGYFSAEFGGILQMNTETRIGKNKIGPLLH